MKPVIGFFAAALGLLLLATVVLVLLPYYVLPRRPSSSLTVEELRGRQSYVSLGCMYCHSQQPRDRKLSAADAAWGWGEPSRPEDYAGQDPHQLGTMRTGPDLWNIGQRQPSRDWHLLHLAQPRAVTPESIMPAYPFLFSSSPGTTVSLEVPGRGTVYARPEALELVAYLLSLKGGQHGH